MSDDRLKTLRQQLRDAEKALRDLPKEERDSYREPFARLQKILAYSAVVLETSDVSLLSDGTFNAISDALAQVINNPPAAGPNAGAWGGLVLDAVARLPVAHDRRVEQEVKEAAANFKRSASQHLKGLEEDIEATATDAEERRATLQEELAELQQAVENERVRLGQLATEESETFREAQEKRAQEASEQSRQLEADLETIKAEGQGKVDEQVTEMERVKEEMVDLSGAVALVGTSERYGTEAKSQRWTANFWAALTIAIALLAVAAAAKAATVSNPHETEFIGKLAISVILAGISRYTAIQSSRARKREAEARGLQLDLAVFGPFVEPLERAQQEEERVIMTRKTFGKVRGQDLGEDDPGPMPLSQLMRRQQAGDKADEAG